MSGPCSFPECEKPVASRGLCITHVHQARYAKDPAVRAEAQKYIAPPKRRRHRKAGGNGDPADEPFAEVGQVVDMPELAAVPHGRHVEILVGTLCKFATVLGVGRCHHNPKTNERIWTGPNGETVMVDAEGRLHHVRRTIGEAIEI